MTTRPTRIHCEIDLERDGKQLGFARLPHSVHRSAYGWLPMPIASIRNGDGPRVLLMSGNHGDEYEGQVTLCRLARELEPARVKGRVIILPMANYPAAHAGLRTSPLDDGNLNREFPGDPDGGPTAQIAYYIETELMARADYFVDLHSGGSSLDYLPSAILGGDVEAPSFAERLGMLKAFGAPYAFVFPGGHSSGVASAAAARQGALAVGTEMAGAGTVTPRALRICEQGVRNVLAHLGVVTDHEIAPLEGPTRILRAEDMRSFAYAPEVGLFEPVVELGDEVREGDLDFNFRQRLPKFPQMFGQELRRRLVNGQTDRTADLIGKRRLPPFERFGGALHFFRDLHEFRACCGLHQSIGQAVEKAGG